jgi:hypothetical protein
MITEVAGVLPQRPDQLARSSSKPANYPCFAPAEYAIDVTIPIIKTGQAEDWRPNAAANWGGSISAAPGSSQDWAGLHHPGSRGLHRAHSEGLTPRVKTMRCTRKRIPIRRSLLARATH